ncbi:hypothetical protein CTI12_AA157580 [Artemisia annua]|uniref:Uncharacterized protein n=1 Tax=Artemisia annua TaxID=35608 RepID=A0A2U1PGA7_ARTAN|nr:hypothetical protein CTI12_AA157580 [Artemisia annua]
MESSDFIDTVKAEKMHAIARYNLFTSFKKFVQIFEFFVLIAIISWLSSRVPIIFKFSSEHIFTFSSYVMNQHVVFLVSNVIVILCYVLSRDHSDAGNVTTGECTDAQVVDSPVKPPESELPVTVEVKAIKKAVKQIERFKRTQSEKLKSEITTKPRRELRRSVTEKKRSGDDVAKVTSSKNDVERLSNEEFRIAIEAFISKQQTLIKQQK